MEIAGVTLINATQVIDLLGIPGSNKMTLAERLDQFGLKPVAVIQQSSGKPMYLYDQAVVSSALPNVKATIKRLAAERRVKAQSQAAHMVNRTKQYKAWVAAIGEAKTLHEIDAVIAQIRHAYKAVPLS